MQMRRMKENTHIEMMMARQKHHQNVHEALYNPHQFEKPNAEWCEPDPEESKKGLTDKSMYCRYHQENHKKYQQKSRAKNRDICNQEDVFVETEQRMTTHVHEE